MVATKALELGQFSSNLTADANGNISATTTNLTYTGTLTGANGIINIGSGQLYKDTSGNFGIGTITDSWISSLKALQIETTSIAANPGAWSLFGHNTYYGSTGYVYKLSDYAAMYQQGAGEHRFYSAPSGAASTAVSFTQVMTLHNSGGLSLGNTSDPGAKAIGIGLAASPVGSFAGGIDFTGYTTGYGASIRSYVPSSAPGIDYQDIRFYTAAGPSNPNTLRMTIDAYGNLILGNTTQRGTLTILANQPTAFSVVGNTAPYQGLALSNSYGNSSTFAANFIDGRNENQIAVNSIALSMNADGSSYFDFNVTGPGSRTSDRRYAILSMYPSQPYPSYPGSYMIMRNQTNLFEASLEFNAGNGPTGESYIVIRHPSTAGSGSWYQSFFYNGNVIGSIYQNGTTGVSYSTSSDQRLKKNILDANSALSSIKSIQIRQFDWKADNSHQDYGVITQELVTIAPEAVEAVFIPTDPNEMQAVDYSKLVPRMIKAMQEQQTIIEDLQARLTKAGL